MKYWLFVFLPFMTSAQQADELFAKLSQKFKQVRNYEVSAQIKPNIPAIKILPVKANVQFTYPNPQHQKSKFIINIFLGIYFVFAENNFNSSLF